MRAKRLVFSSDDHPDLTHYLFRYPAKFHPPVARALLEVYTSKTETVLDPFCGSGTLLVEALAVGRNTIGVDVDPVAAFVTRSKVHPYSAERLANHAEVLGSKLSPLRRSAKEYEKRQFIDVAEHRYRQVLQDERLCPPSVPNLRHWFRRYVIIDLCRILKAIYGLKCSAADREFFLLNFASIIRRASNADPVPVSGLEVTKHMKNLDAAGRLIDPFALFTRALKRALAAVQDLAAKRASGASTTVIHGSATDLKALVSFPVDAVITSPPYHNAVDYYRRHQLESYWLGLVATHEERLALRSRYLGQAKVRQSDPVMAADLFEGKVVREWEGRMRGVSAERANALHHYVNSMRLVFNGLASQMRSGSPAVFVVGHSSWNSSLIPTTEMFKELAAPWFALREYRWYPITNRYMSYSRRNGANIDREYVLVFERQRCAAR